MGRAGVVVVLAAGQGKRMRTAGPKVLQPLCGRAMLAYVVDQAAALEPERILIVVGRGADEVREALPKEVDAQVTFVEQAEQRGTGHAVACCLDQLGEGPGPAVVLYGDMPAVRPETLQALCEAQAATEGGATLLTAIPDHARGFGRILRRGGPEGPLERIVEERDASPEERAIREVNVGVYAFPVEALRRHLPNLNSDNAQGELYLTDVVGAMVAEGKRALPLVLDEPEEAAGVNTLAELGRARALIQAAILEEHLGRGVFIEDPASTFIDYGVEIGAGSRILPCTVIRRGVRIGEDCEVGPFSHLRVGSVLEDRAEVGNFTETKNARVGEHTKAKHLSYLGDVDIGAGANIGAGTIVANYDGKAKHKTSIGDRAFIGSGSILIAPTTVEEDASTGGGAVVTRGSRVPAGDTWIGIPARSLKERQSSSGSGS